jgi:hypothetical protein
MEAGEAVTATAQANDNTPIAIGELIDRANVASGALVRLRALLGLSASVVKPTWRAGQSLG